MINFSKGLYERAMAASAITALIGDRFYEVEAPQEAGLPYVTYSVISDVNTPTFTEKLESIRVQFSILSREVSTTQLKSIMAAIESVFDVANYNVTSGRVESTERVTKFYDSFLTDDGAKEWQGFIDYEILYQKY